MPRAEVQERWAGWRKSPLCSAAGRMLHRREPEFPASQRAAKLVPRASLAVLEQGLNCFRERQEKGFPVALGTCPGKGRKRQRNRDRGCEFGRWLTLRAHP